MIRIAVASDVLVSAVLRDGDFGPNQAERILKKADLVAVAIPPLCEFVHSLQQDHGLAANDVARAVHVLLRAEKVVANRPAIAAALASIEAGGTFIEGLVAFESQRLGANNFVSFEPDSMRRVERLMSLYR
ncbi:VapC toxin family PIN domain ribonuclease [Novosphingobium sp. PS1R-30]|uniref:VapC toxin family PIN domain ribonuclease n=1 Tax=Novosphingobium anseongense TaxID=3133436 RepID=A0ABU8RY06_9SPHN